VDSKGRSMRLRIMAALLLALLITFFHRFAIGVVADDLQRELLLSAAALSNLGAAYFYVYGVLQLPVGFILDGLGPKRLTAAGMVTAAAGSFLFAAAPNYGLALLGRIIVTTGLAGIFLSILKVQSIWFEARYFSLLAGITSSVGNLGAVLAQAPLAAAAAAWGWRTVFFGLGSVSLFSAAAIWIVVADRPEDRGVTPIHHYEQADRRALFQGLYAVLRNPHTWPAAVAFSGLMGTNMALGGVWGVSYLSHIHGFGRETAAMLMLWMTLGLLLGSPVVGFLAGKIGRLRPIICGGSTAALVVYAVLWIAPTLPIWAWTLLFLALGLSAISFILCFTSVKEANNLRYSGIATSVVNFSAFSVSALISLLMGWALDVTWDGVLAGSAPVYSLASFRWALGILLLFNLLGLTAAFFLYERAEKKCKPAPAQRYTG